MHRKKYPLSTQPGEFEGKKSNGVFYPGLGRIK
jgi:hypothetical protein